MVSKEEAIAELAKLLANGAISAEAFTMSVSALNNAGSSSDSEAKQPPKEKTRDEKIYETVMEYIRNQMISPSTVKYPPFSERIETEVDSLTNLILPRYTLYDLPKFLRIDEDTGKYLLTEWKSYFDAQNTFGAMIRERCSFIFDENKNLISVSYTAGGNLFVMPLEVVKEFVIHEDSIEEELYNKYMSEYMKGRTNWSYLPYNKRMLRTTEYKVVSRKLFDITGKNINVTYIYTKIYSDNRDYEDTVLLLDGKDTFNLIRIIEFYRIVGDDGKIYYSLEESDASKN